MTTYKELLAQREALEKQIQDARQRELRDAISKIRDMIAEYGLTQDDVFPTRGRRGESAGAKVAPKYRNPATGETWSGRGKAPKWIQGQDREQFAISA